MKTFLTSVLLCALLQMLWFSLSTQTDASGVDCSTFENATDCCRSACTFFNCTGKVDIGMCINASATANCTDSGETANIVCTAEPPATDPCRQHLDNMTCCNATEDSCGFFSCTNTTGTYEVCAQINATSICATDDDETANNNTCTVPVALDACSNYTELAGCCGAPDSDQCAFYNCSGTPNTTVCRRNTTEQGDICPETKEVVEIPCSDESTTTTPQTTVATSTTRPASTTPHPKSSTKAPSTGGGGSGHGFDGASFIGGIVLCGGLVAIGYFGLKFYRSRQERNYHTL